MLTSENHIGFRCTDKYNNQEWSIQLRTVRLNNVHCCEILKTMGGDHRQYVSRGIVDECGQIYTQTFVSVFGSCHFNFELT